MTSLISTTIGGDPNTRFHFPQSLMQCVTKVLSGEYEYISLPDERPIRTVVDIGGNVGAFAAWAYLRFKRPWIESYEPLPEAADVYEKNAPPGAIVKRLAVTTSHGPVKLNLGADWGQGSLLTGRSVLSGQTIEVPTIHPRELPRCDLLKIDAEGCEPEILREYPYLGRCAVVMFEWHTQEDLFACEYACRSVGLRLVKSVLDRPDLGLQVWVHSEARYNIDANRYET